MPWVKTADDRRQDSQRYGPAWRKARKKQLELDQHRCQARLDGCTGRATEVDHVTGAGNDPGHMQLRSVCTPCHRKITAQQGGGWRKQRPSAADPPPQSRTVW